MPIFAVTLHLVVEGPDDLRRRHVERVTGSYAAIEAADVHLLGGSWRYGERGRHAEVDAELTVEAEDKATAFVRASTGVWAAIRAAGGFTPAAGERAPGPATVVYREIDEKVELVLG